MILKKTINLPLYGLLKTMALLWRKNNRHCNARYWSNDELKKFAHLFNGNVVNLSAGEDNDKEGGFYRSYFCKASSYSITNYKKCFEDNESYTETELDLEKPLERNSGLVSHFDVVFNHTVLEHIYKIDIAVANLCLISRDIIISVVPFLQSFHHAEEKYFPGRSFHDYWRFTPYSVYNIFNEHGFKTIFINWNYDPVGNIYLFHIASKYPEKWGVIKAKQNIDNRKAPGFYHQRIISKTTNVIGSFIHESFTD